MAALELNIGDKIKIGPKYAKEYNFNQTEITLIKTVFEYDNGLYVVDQEAPGIYNEESKEYDSIYHLFGNDIEDFMDCEVIKD